jgi:PAS domain S-box-containing protein
VRDYQTLADHSADMIVRINRERRIVYVSPSCQRLGYRPVDLVGATIDRLVHPDAVQPLRRGLDAILSGQYAPTGEPYEMQIRNRSGDWVWAEGSSQVVLGTDGEPEGVVTQLRDITQRRAVQQALAESESRYRLLADLGTDIVVTMDAKGIIRYISPACRRLGFTPEEMVGRRGIDFVNPADAELALSRAGLLLTGQRQQGEGMEYRARTKDGGWVWLEGASTVVRDEAGAIIMISHLRDVTERRAFEDELRRKHADAEAATLAKSEFLANMSHEIRTPLTGIMGFAGLLERVEGLPAEAQAYAARIATASRTLLTVVNDILDFSKIEAGQVELDPQPFDPAAFVAETLELVAVQAQQKQLSLQLETEGPLPVAVTADSDRLRQVLLNLLSNAVKFTDAGGVTVGVAFEPDGGGRLRVSVADTGVGIARDRLGRLFQRFSQADGSINRQYGGTGLGLAICKGLTELMGGEIGVESVEGHGSTFWFTIAAPPCAPAPAAAHEPEGVFDVRPARILIVDDTPVNRELVSTLLGVFGHDLREASGGEEAVEAAAHAAFDLILMDLQMPGMDGIAATRAIRATSVVNRATPIVALSANILPTHIEACRAAGMDDHIGKPIDTRELLTKVARWTAPNTRAERTRKAG